MSCGAYELWIGLGVVVFINYTMLHAALDVHNVLETVSPLETLYIAL